MGLVVVIVGIVAWIALGTWMMRSGNRSKRALLESLTGKQATIRYSPMRTVFRVSGVVRQVERGRVRISSGTEEKVIAINSIREILAEGVHLRRK